jgi:hypothetical protein
MFHDLLVFQNLVKSSEWSYLNERRAFSTCDKLNWTDGDVADMLCGLLPADHQKTVHDTPTKLRGRRLGIVVKDRNLY